MSDAAIEAGILGMTAAAGPGRSISPSDVAAALQAEGWQSLLGRVRRVAVALMEAGRIEVLRKGRPVAAAEVRGVIRMRVRAAP